MVGDSGCSATAVGPLAHVAVALEDASTEAVAVLGAVATGSGVTAALVYLLLLLSFVALTLAACRGRLAAARL